MVPLASRQCFVIIKFAVPLRPHRNFRWEDGNGDNGEDGDDSGSPCALTLRCARHWAKDFTCIDSRSFQTMPESTNHFLMPGEAEA